MVDRQIQISPSLSKSRSPVSSLTAIIMTAPMFFLSLYVFSKSLYAPTPKEKLVALIIIFFMTILFFLMIKTGKTNSFRKIFFITLGVLYPIGFLATLFQQYGAMTISMERVLSGEVRFCHIVLTMMLFPAALTKTIIFPQTILPTAANPYSFAYVAALWMGGAIVLGRAWCSWCCFLGGFDETFSSILRKPLVRELDRRWRLLGWSVLIIVIFASAMTLAPFYCQWLCPFKPVTEFAEIRNFQTLVQIGTALILFLTLVVILPFLTKKRTQCAFFCPLGPLQSLFNKINIFEVTVDQSRCSRCGLCVSKCKLLARYSENSKDIRVTMYCSKCGACVDTCKNGAAQWHIKGTKIGTLQTLARWLFLYSAWIMATIIGSIFLARSLLHLLNFIY